MTVENLSIAWFRQDLRMTDNPALSAAAECGEVLPIYILDDVNAGDSAMGAPGKIKLVLNRFKLSRSRKTIDAGMPWPIIAKSSNQFKSVLTLKAAVPDD